MAVEKVYFALDRKDTTLGQVGQLEQGLGKLHNETVADLGERVLTTRYDEDRKADEATRKTATDAVRTDLGKRVDIETYRKDQEAIGKKVSAIEADAKAAKDELPHKVDTTRYIEDRAADEADLATREIRLRAVAYGMFAFGRVVAERSGDETLTKALGVYEALLTDEFPEEETAKPKPKSRKGAK